MGLTAGDLRSQQLQSALVNKERIEREKQEVGCPDDPRVLHRKYGKMSCRCPVFFGFVPMVLGIPGLVN